MCLISTKWNCVPSQRLNPQFSATLSCLLFQKKSFDLLQKKLFVSAFRGSSGLRDHLSKHDSILYPRLPSRHSRASRPKRQQCNLCSYSSIHGNLKKHMLKHGEGQPLRKFEFTCHICDKQFRLAASLESHSRIHDEVRDFHCTYCKSSFTKPHYLRIHIDGVHLKKKPNKCDQCDAAYFMSNDLKRHKIHKHTTERPFQCYLCQKTYMMSTYLRKHIGRVHKFDWFIDDIFLNNK